MDVVGEGDRVDFEGHPIVPASLDAIRFSITGIRSSTISFFCSAVSLGLRPGTRPLARAY